MQTSHPNVLCGCRLQAAGCVTLDRFAVRTTLWLYFVTAGASPARLSLTSPDPVPVPVPVPAHGSGSVSAPPAQRSERLSVYCVLCTDTGYRLQREAVCCRRCTVYCVLIQATGYRLQHSSDSVPRPCWRPCDGTASVQRPASMHCPCLACDDRQDQGPPSIIAAELYIVLSTTHRRQAQTQHHSRSTHANPTKPSRPPGHEKRARRSWM